MKHSPLVLALLLSAFVIPHSSFAAAQRPNILFIAIDDLRPEIGAYGVNCAITPNIDKLAAKSVRFDRAYVTYPLCLPSRASMLTGRRVDYSGLGKQRDFSTLIGLQQTWPATFHKAGYWTATSGKIYHGSPPKNDIAAWDVPGEQWRNDFKDWSPELMKKVVAEAGPKEVVEDFRKKGGGSGSLLCMAVDGDDDVLTDGQTASLVMGYLRDRPKDKPFVICAGFSRPHMPWIAPKKYFDLYKDAKIELPKLPEGAKRELFKEDIGSGVSKDAAKWNEGVSDDEARELIKGYLASVSYSDAQVGRILSALQQSGQADNTIIILWGDHGYHLTEHGLWRKNTIYHVANRIPLLIHAPGKATGVSQRLVESIDLYPTLLALTGTSADGLRVDGRSLVPLLEKPDAEWPHPAFIHANKDHGMVTDQYRYSISNNGTEKLFDLRADPDEWKNLAADPAHAARVKQMRAAVEQAWKGDVVTEAPPAAPKKGKGKKKANAQPAPAPATQASVDGRTLLFAEDFNRSDASTSKDGVGNGWETNSDRRAGGRKQATLKDGALTLTTAPGADHNAVVSHSFAPAARDWFIAVRFRMEPGEDFALDLNDPQCKEVWSGHIANVAVDRKGVTLRDSKTGVMNLALRERRSSGQVDAALEQLLATKTVTLPFKPIADQWHELGIATRGDVMTVSVDGKELGQLKSEGIAHATKRKISLSAKKSPVLDDVKVWALN